MDQRASRTDKLLSITQNELLTMVRRWCFTNYGNQSTAHVTKVLKHASGNEIEWLREKFGTIPDFDENNHFKKLAWICSIMKDDDDPRTYYYHARAIYCINYTDDNCLRFLRHSAEAGFAPAMARLTHLLFDEQEKRAWIQKGVELGDRDALYLLGRHREAAELGSIEAMRECEGFEIRAFLLTGYGSDYRNVSGLSKAIRDKNAKVILNTFYRFGRELEGYEQFWDQVLLPEHFLLQCIDLYLTVIHRARRAALQTTFGLRRILGRDVAGMIGKMVYETKTTDCIVWWKMEKNVPILKKVKGS